MDRQAFLKMLMNKNQQVIQLQPISLGKQLVDYEKNNKKNVHRIKIVQFSPNHVVTTHSKNNQKYRQSEPPLATINLEINPNQLKNKWIYNKNNPQATNRLLESQALIGQPAYEVSSKVIPIKNALKYACQIPKRFYQRSLTISQPNSESPQMIRKVLYADFSRKSVELVSRIQQTLQKPHPHLSHRLSQPHASTTQTYVPPKNNKPQIKISKEPSDDQRKQAAKTKKQIYQNYGKPFNPPTNISAYSYIVYEPNFSQCSPPKNKKTHTKFVHSHKVLISINSRNSVEIASLTKIMTCILALQICERYQIQVNEQIINVGKFQSNIGGTSAKICPGQIYNLQQMLYGLMLPSGNDASVAIAVWGGKILLYCDENMKTGPLCSNEIKQIGKKYKKKECYSRFIVQMNNKAKQLDLKKTTYANPHGLINNNNKSCSYDLAVLCEYALQNKYFKKIVSTRSYCCQIKASIQVNFNKGNKEIKKKSKTNLKNDENQEQQENGQEKDLIEEEEQQQDLKVDTKYIQKNISWENTHRLLHQKPNQYIGIKTGVTTVAGPCLASCIQTYNGRCFIIIVLGCQKLALRFRQTQILKKWIYDRERISPQKPRIIKKNINKRTQEQEKEDEQSSQSQIPDI